MNCYTFPHGYRRSIRPQRSNRHGYSLIEAMGMIFLLGTIMSLASIAIHRSAQTQKLALRCIQHNRLLDDFHHRLLMDTRAAREVKIADNAFELINSQGLTIEYTTQAGVITRTLKSSNSETVGQARWQIGVRQLQVEVDASGELPLAKYSLKLDRLLADRSAIASNAGDGTTESTENHFASAADNVHWVSRLGVDTQ